MGNMTLGLFGSRIVAKTGEDELGVEPTEYHAV